MNPLPIPFDLLLFPLVMVSLVGWGMGCLAILPWVFTPGHTRELTRLVVFWIVGRALTMVVYLGLGWFGGYHPAFHWVWLAVGLGCFAMHYKTIHWPSIADDLAPHGILEKGALVSLLLMLGFHLLGSFAPVFGYDEVTYHLLVPKQFLLAGHCHCTPNLIQANFPFYEQTFTTFLFGIGGSSLAKLMHLGLLVLSVLLIISLLRQLQCSHPWIGALFFTTVVCAVYVRAPIEVGTELPLTLYMLAGIALISQSSPPELFLAAGWLGFINGLAWGTKLTAPFFVTLPQLVFMLVLFRQRRVGWKHLFSAVALAGIVVGVLYLPWLLRHHHCTGNPFFPFLTNWFSVEAPYDHMVEQLAVYEHNTNFYARASVLLKPGDHSTWSPAISAWLSGAIFDKVIWSVYQGDYLLVLAPLLALFFLFARQSGMKPYAWATLFVSASFFLMYGAHLNRFFSVTYGLLAVVVWVGIDWLFKQTRLRNSLSLLLILFLAWHWFHTQSYWCQLVGWHGKPYLTEQARAEFRMKYLSGPAQIDFFERIPNFLSNDSYVMGYNLKRAYHVPYRAYSVGDYEEDLPVWLFRKHQNWDKVAEVIRSMGFTHLLVNTTTGTPWPESWLDKYWQPILLTEAGALYQWKR